MIAITPAGDQITTATMANDVKHIKIGTVTKSEIGFLKSALSTDKTRERLMHAVVRYSHKLAGFAVVSTDTHRAHVVNLGNLFDAPIDVEITLDVNMIARQITALKVNAVDIWCVVSPAGEFIAGGVSAPGIDHVSGAVIKNEGFPQFEFFINDHMHHDNYGMVNDVNAHYISDAVIGMAGSRNSHEMVRVRFWQDRSKNYTSFTVLDHTAGFDGTNWHYGRCFAVIMPMAPVR